MKPRHGWDKCPDPTPYSFGCTSEETSSILPAKLPSDAQSGLAATAPTPLPSMLRALVTVFSFLLPEVEVVVVVVVVAVAVAVVEEVAEVVEVVVESSSSSSSSL